MTCSSNFVHPILVSWEYTLFLIFSSKGHWLCFSLPNGGGVGVVPVALVASGSPVGLGVVSSCQCFGSTGSGGHLYSYCSSLSVVLIRQSVSFGLWFGDSMQSCMLLVLNGFGLHCKSQMWRQWFFSRFFLLLFLSFCALRLLCWFFIPSRKEPTTWSGGFSIQASFWMRFYFLLCHDLV